MLKPGDVIPLTIEKPAAGGPMIARHDGRVVLVSGAIPGERVQARLARIAKGVAPADTVVGTTYACTANDTSGTEYTFSVRISSPTSFVIEDYQPS